MQRYVFAVGVMRDRTITVQADSQEEADGKARDRLDRIAESRGDEAPVRWDLALKAVRD